MKSITLKILLVNLLLCSGLLFIIISGDFFYIQLQLTAHQGHFQLTELFYLLAVNCGAMLFIISLMLLKSQLNENERIKRKKNKLEKKLKKSEERLMLSTEGSGIGIWDWEPGSEILYLSPYFKKMLGYTEKELPNVIQSLNNILHPDDYDDLWNHVKQHLEENVPFKIEYRLKTKSGEYRWFRAAGQSQRNAENLPLRMLGSTVDITEIKQSKVRLEILNLVTRTLSYATSLENASLEMIRRTCLILQWELGSLWIVDNEKNVMRCVTIWHIDSIQAEPFTIKTREQLFKPGEGLPGKVWEKKAPVWIEDITEDKIFRGAIAKSVGFHTGMGFPILLKNETLGMIEFFTKKKLKVDDYLLETMLAIGRQIGQFVQRKKAEKEANDINAFNLAILESADSTILLDESEQIISFNLQTLRMFGFESEVLKNKSIDTLIADWKLHKEKLFEKTISDFTALKSDGTYFPVEIKFSKIQSHRKNIYVIFIRDITERKTIENMKNEFVSIVSHELRTPLTSIRGSLGLILSGKVSGNTEKMKKLLDIANSNCERLLMLINDILDMEKIEAGKMDFTNEIINVTALIDKSILINKPFAKKFGIELKKIELSPDLKIKADPDRLMQALTNLLSNAVKYSFPKEIVTISVGKINDNIRISITNKGPGIPEEFHSRIFQKFSQADSTSTRGKGGTGLGLNICKKIIDRLGGSIQFISIPNETTTFYIDLPTYDKLIKSSETLENKLSLLMKNIKPFPSHKKLLICDDDEDQAIFLRTLLESAGFETEIAINVAEAKKLLENNTYHALLLDLILPDQDGITFIRQLRQNEETRALPIVVLSIIAQKGKQLLNGDAFYVLDWLNKPIDFKKLLAVIEKMPSTQGELAILHIENDVDTTTIVKNIIGHAANIDSALDIQQALHAINNKKYNLIILDLILPDGNGVTLLPLFSRYQIPVIVYSAYELDEEYGKLVNQVLIKSKTSNEEILSTVKNALDSQKYLSGEKYEKNT